MPHVARALLALGLLVVAARPAHAQALQIFDAHIHYSQSDWDALTPERALSVLARANVFRALVSSTPDDGTLKLYDRSPRGIVPFLRPYRNRGDMATWPHDVAVASYVEERLKRGIYRGIGEFHLSASDVEAPVVKRFAVLAEQRNIFWQAHVDDVTVEKLLTLYPRVRILWAHAGMSASADTVARMLDRYPKLCVELALRLDVEPGERLRRRRPRDLVHLVIVLADLLDRTHEEPLHGLLHAPAVALKPIGHRLQLARDLAVVTGLFTHFAQGRVDTLLSRRQRALGQRPDRSVAKIARPYQQDAAIGIDDENTRRELEDAPKHGHSRESDAPDSDEQRTT